MRKINLELINKLPITRFPKLSCFIAGLMLKLCFCRGIIFTILIIPSIAILIKNVIRSPRRRSTFLMGYLFGLGYFGSTLYWIAESFKCVGYGNYGYLAVLCLVLYLSIFPALSCGFAKLLATSRLNLMILFSVFWVFFEYLRGILFTGFPWNLIGYSSIGIPYFSQIADIFGIYGVSFFLILISVFFTARKTIPYAITLLVAICSYGCYVIHFGDYIEPNKKAVVSLVQPSISQIDKNDFKKMKENINKHIGLSIRSPRKLKLYEGTRIIVWPEAAINTPIKSEGDILKYISTAIKKSQEIIITGCDRYTSAKKLYNSAFIFGHDAKVKQSYDKRHLLPFGEYIPEFLKFWQLKKLTKGIIDFSSGTLPRTIKLEGFAPFEIVICYEIAFPGEVMDSDKSFWILNITNDSWFGRSDGPSQHMRMARYRAIEEGRSVARCANNGISCIIDCNGKVVKSLETDEIGTIDEVLPLRYRKTFYAKHKNKPIMILLSVLAIIPIVTRRRLSLRTSRLFPHER